MDNTDNTRTEIRAHTQAVLKAIDVSRIIVVDDEFRELEVEELLGLCAAMTPRRASALPHLADIDFNADQEVWAHNLRETWSSLEWRTRKEVLGKARTLEAEEEELPVEGTVIEGGSERLDSEAAGSLEDILAQLDGCEYVPLSLRQWQARGEAFLHDDKADETVFLFDRDLRHEGGSDNEGLTLVRQVQAASNGCCGLLTHTVNVSNEADLQREVIDAHDLDAHRFVVIAKERLTSDQLDKYQFLRMLRFVGLSKRYAIIKTATWSVLGDAVASATAAVERLSVSDFDRIVFGSSRKEGVWEPDTLFRVFGILLRREAQQMLRQNDEVISAAVDARRISALSETLAGALGSESASEEAVRMQRFEAYESGEVLNAFHLPIDAGDIFLDSNTDRPYVLLAQPCDLMVRDGGKRNYDKRVGRTGGLVELVFDGEKRIVFEGKKEKDSWGELPFYHEHTGGSAFADFARVHQALLSVLDLCVLQDDGVAKIDLSDGCPNSLIEPWKARYERLTRLFATAVQRYEQLPKDLRFLALPRLAATMGVQGTAADNTVEYSFKRVLRLRQPWSGALLTAFAQYQSRAAFEHPLDHRVREAP